MQPPPPPPAEPELVVTLPAADDPEFVTKLMVQADADDATHLKASIAQFHAELYARDGVVDQARNRPAMTFDDVLRAAIPRLCAMEHLQAELDRHTPQSKSPPRPSLADQLLALVRSVGRFKSDEELRQLRTSQVTRLRVKLAGSPPLEAGISQDLINAVRNHHRMVQHHVRKGIDDLANLGAVRTSRDGATTRLRALHADHLDTSRRLKALGGGREATAAAMTSAVNAAGGADAVAAAIAAGMLPGLDLAASLRTALRAVEGALAAADPEGSRAEDLAAERTRLEQSVADAERQTAERKQAAAMTLVNTALQGDLKSVADLEGRTPHEGLKSACRTARGDDVALVAVCQEMINQWLEKSR
jgi:hypothetical protein